jgi:AraC family transcriptional regulator, transcriptional activator of the genes for pyochelin and ferripyochelin receptors
MELRLTDKDIVEAIKATIAEGDGNSLQKGLNVPMSRFLSDYCRGSTWMIEFRPGFQLNISEVAPSEDLVITLDMVHPQFGIVMCLSGKMRGTFQKQPEPIILEETNKTLCFTSQSMQLMEYKGGAVNRSVTVKVDPKLLIEFFKDDPINLPAEIKATAKKNDNFFHSSLWPASTALSMTIHQILNCPYQGELKRAYLECKAIELVIHQLAMVSGAEERPNKKPGFHAADEKRIREARRLLIGNLESPPTLKSLARMVGLNKDKLNDGFRRFYGTSVFDYFNSYRMEHARRLLDERRMDITEIAFSAGFSQPCSFTRAFKRRFGVAPRNYQTLHSA